MKQKEVFKKIGGIIQELSDQYQYLKTVEDDLNDLELELFVSNAHFLTDHIEILCKLNLQNKIKRTPLLEKPELPDDAAITSSQQKFFEPVVQQMKPSVARAAEKAARLVKAVEAKPVEQPEEEEAIPEIDLTTPQLQETFSLIQEEPETIRHELIMDEADIWDDEEYQPKNEPIAIIEEEEETPVVYITPEPEPYFEPIIPIVEVKEEPVVYTEPDEVLTINQKMSSQLGDKAGSKTDQLAIKPINDIKVAITLNDKLLYVKDLFNGYNLAYSEAIEILNRFESFEEAARFLKTNYVTKNNWESKPETTEKFYALLKRRYA
ncbi:hypothetical protein JN11_00164 [Mucilaginibacter frigoritolerans]|uniref:Uncharacterized protein n=1 Tax=Mucilaginibacter frigoritolerans TaxID=652788 RepID=A0A562UH05_9SPHI|nr:hypothetical protein [Mucilaginibacter frigoritolerans]TWJ04455.1 hypothetical protein JN11_00164 [Mucilaginibacter frigoritolerans]